MPCQDYHVIIGQVNKSMHHDHNKSMQEFPINESLHLLGKQEKESLHTTFMKEGHHLYMSPLILHEWQHQICSYNLAKQGYKNYIMKTLNEANLTKLHNSLKETGLRL